MSERPVSIAGEPKADVEQARAFGLTPDEYRKIEQIIGRTPTYTELGVFSVMWSEHCSYKSSRRHLRMLPSKSELVVQGPGENAGAIDVGDGWAAVFKIESHNHPSFVEPYQGAATGVGGILRDIFTMGARPVASMNSLKFGSFEHPRTRYLLGGVVGGIGGYGNCVGVPTVAGEVMFDAAYNANILVNAFCLGLVRKGEMMSARARGVGNPVLYVGSATGRDGIHGASMASAEFDKDERGQAAGGAGRRSVHREIVDRGVPRSGQDRRDRRDPGHGRGRTDVVVERDAVAWRTGNRTRAGPSATARGESDAVRNSAFRIAGADADRGGARARGGIAGGVREMGFARGRHRAHHRRPALARAMAWAGGRRYSDWRAGRRRAAVRSSRGAAEDPEPLTYRPRCGRPHLPRNNGRGRAVLRALLDSPNVASKKWVYRQYDSIVQSNTVLGPGSDAAVLRIKDSRRAMALKVDSNPRACALDPYLGAVGVVCEAARNVACAGARPVGITNCLNYGNPERPEVMWQFIRGVEGLRDASIAFGAPVVSGNVSFYNETEGHAIPPTPTIAVLGVMIDVASHVTQHFKNPGDAIAIVRTGKPSLAASEYAALFGIDGGQLGAIDLAREAALVEGLVEGV